VNSLNSVTLLGVVSREIEVKYTQAGLCIVDFTLAGSDQFVTKDGEVKYSPWYQRISTIGKPAEILSERIVAGDFDAGSPVLVSGILETREWEQEGKKRKVVQVKANRIERVYMENAELITDGGGGFRLVGGINEVRITGGLSQDIETKLLPTGDSVANGSVAVTESWYTKDNTKMEKTHWIDVTFWREVAISASDLRKGDSIFVSGRLKNESWTDKDGQKRSSVKVEADQAEKIIRKKSQGDLSKPATSLPKSAVNNTPAPQQVPVEDELPF
jgi:single-strand DNA-binding protein